MTNKKISSIAEDLAQEKSSRPRVAKSAVKDDLMDFDQFVARTPKKSGNKTWIFVVLVLIILALLGSVLFFSKDKFVKEVRFKTVVLDNGQVYFAKVVKEDALNIFLSDVYYIQTEQQVIPATEEDGEDQVKEVPVLIKRGQELHQPSGLMQVNRDKVVSIEEIGANSEILKEIERQAALPAVTQ